MAFEKNDPLTELIRQAHNLVVLIRDMAAALRPPQPQAPVLPVHVVVPDVVPTPTPVVPANVAVQHDAGEWAERVKNDTDTAVTREK